MGQKQSKRVSSTSSQAYLTTYSSPPNSPTPPTTRCEEITPPAAPRELTRLSEILDPREVLNDEIYNVTPSRPRASRGPHTDAKSPGLQPLIRPSLSRAPTSIVHSPSGNALGAEEFVRHPNRPLAMWERQERVMQATREGVLRLEAESRIGNRSRMGTRRSRMGEVTEQRRKRRRGCCSCWLL